MIDPLKNIEDDFADLDPTKLGVDVEPRYLDRKIVITLSAPDDKSFNAIAKFIEALNNAYTEELQHYHSSP